MYHSRCVELTVAAHCPAASSWLMMHASAALVTLQALPWLAPCVSHHLNPRLYPGRPEVSFLVQYFHRPKAIDR